MTVMYTPMGPAATRSRFASMTLVLAAALAAAAALRADNLRQQSGPYAITLQLPPAGLFAGEEMEIEFKVVKADGTPLPWGRIRGVVDMPSMPSMPPFDEIAHREDVVGVFGVHPTFPHGGDYRLCLTVLPPEVQPVGDPRPTDSFTFEFPLTVWDSAASPTRESRKIKPYALDVVATPRHPAAGEPVELELRVRMATSFELREVTDFELLHERLMHLFVVSQDLSDFAHEHPEPAGPGLFRLSHRFARPGRYRLFADVAPRDAGAQVLDATLVVGPAAGGGAAPVPAATPTPAPKTRTQVALTLPDGGMVAGRTLVVNAFLTDEKGRPVRDLEPWLGAIGHLLLVTRDGETFAHSHPDDREPGVGKDGRIPFLVRLPRAGPYKGWLQFQRRGKVETLEVAMDAAPYSAPR